MDYWLTIKSNEGEAVAKLSSEEALMSRSEVEKLYMAASQRTLFEAKVALRKNGEEIFNELIDVAILNEGNDFIVAIMFDGRLLKDQHHVASRYATSSAKMRMPGEYFMIYDTENSVEVSVRFVR